MPGGPAMLAATTGAALLPVALWFTDGRRLGTGSARPSSCAEGRLRDRVHAGTQALADVFAREIARAPEGLAHAAAAVAGRPAAAARRRRPAKPSGGRVLMRIGIVCPYSWDIPGGVQAHVRDLAEKLIGLGHDVSVLAPATTTRRAGRDYVVVAGKAVPIPYNGSVAAVQFGLVSAARVRRWLRDGDFDVVHVHEPAPPACRC